MTGFYDMVSSSVGRRATFLALLAASSVAPWLGCSSGSAGSSPSPDAGGSGDAGAMDGGDASAADGGAPETSTPTPEASIDASGDAAPYPAFAVDVARIVDQEGAPVASPTIVTVSWSVDANATTWEAFDDAIGASAYWHTINGEYGVGAATGGGHVSITTQPPPALSNLDVDSLVASSAGSSWPAATASTIYAVYLPPGTGLFLNGEPDAGGTDACQTGVVGYHTESQNSQRLVYVVIPQCAGSSIDTITTAASIELNEAATNPHVFTDPAYAGFDASHLSFELFTDFQDELGDACRHVSTLADTTTEPAFAYSVARQWSNASAAGGHDWCVPAAGPVFYNTTLLAQSQQTTLSVNLSALGMGAGSASSKGFAGTLGQPVSIPLGLFSDGPTGGPWNLDVDLTWPVVDANGTPIDNGTATVAFDRSSGQNGDVVTLTVTPTAWSDLGVVYLAVRSLLPGQSLYHYMPILVGQP
jgi:hypothetical protein